MSFKWLLRTFAVALVIGLSLSARFSNALQVISEAVILCACWYGMWYVMARIPEWKDAIDTKNYYENKRAFKTHPPRPTKKIGRRLTAPRWRRDS